MFTSRAEYRLLLRHDNADFRLREKGFRTGLVCEREYRKFLRRKELLETELKRIHSLRVSAEEANPLLESLKTTAITEKTPVLQLLKRPEVSYDFLRTLCPPPYEVDKELEKLIETEIKYKGYIKRQMEMVERMKRIEGRTIPPDFKFDRISGLSREVLRKLEEVRPSNVGEASRIPGVTPAAIALVMIALEKKRRERSRQ